jgi:hypothetical protein
MHAVARTSLPHMLVRRLVVIVGLLSADWFRYDQHRKTKVAAVTSSFFVKYAGLTLSQRHAFLIAVRRPYEPMRGHRTQSVSLRIARNRARGAACPMHRYRTVRRAISRRRARCEAACVDARTLHAIRLRRGWTFGGVCINVR